MVQIAEWMKQAVDARDDNKTLELLRKQVIEFVRHYPLPSDAR